MHMFTWTHQRVVVVVCLCLLASVFVTVVTVRVTVKRVELSIASSVLPCCFRLTIVKVHSTMNTAHNVYVYMYTVFYYTKTPA